VTKFSLPNAFAQKLKLLSNITQILDSKLNPNPKLQMQIEPGLAGTS
jgi:hypothetical protein